MPLLILVDLLGLVCGSVINRQTGHGCSEDTLAATPWEPLASLKSYPVQVIIIWVGWYISLQYRDTSGNISPMYCDDISVEGMPPQPMP